MLYCGIFIYFYIPNTSYSISHYIIKIFVIIFLGSQESLFVTLTFFQSQLCLLNFCFYFLTQTKRISHYALVVREKKTINFIKIIKNQRNKISFNGASNYLLLSQILRKAFVISNVDEDVVDNRHPFLPVLLPSTGVCKPFQYDSHNFRYAPVTPSISNFLDSPAKFLHNSFNHRRSPGGNYAVGSENWTTWFGVKYLGTTSGTWEIPVPSAQMQNRASESGM